MYLQNDINVNNCQKIRYDIKIKKVNCNFVFSPTLTQILEVKNGDVVCFKLHYIQFDGLESFKWILIIYMVLIKLQK